MTGYVLVATRIFSDYILWPNLTETAVQDAIPTESYGNFGLRIPLLPVPLLPALSCVGHDGQATAAAAAGESEAKTGDHADVLAG
jgi:hypothetical protein